MHRLAILLLLLSLVSCRHEAEDYNIKGIDVSHYQKKIDWQQVGNNKALHFVFIKATEGVNYRDSTFQRNWEGAGKAALKRGAYHFFKPKASVEWQIKNFTKQVTLQKGDLPPVLDIERVGTMPKPKLIEKIGKWLMFVEEHYQVKPIIYASLDLYQKHLQAAFPEHLVWIARYHNTAPPRSTQWQFWQYSDQEYIEGIDHKVDMNVFVGTAAALDKLCIQ